MKPGLESAQSIQVFEPSPDLLYNLDAAAHLAGVTRRTILIYCRFQLIHSVTDPNYGALLFDEAAIHAIRKMEQVRASCGISIQGLKLVTTLLEEVEQLRNEVEFLRSRQMRA